MTEANEDDLPELEGGEVWQKVTFFLVNQTAWSIQMLINDVASLVTEFHSTEHETMVVSSDGGDMWHLIIANICGILIEDVENHMLDGRLTFEAGRTRRPPAKSRRRTG